MFMFRVREAASGDHWTFCVPRQTLLELEPDAKVDQQAAFDRFRPRIYAAAQELMTSADPTAQHVLRAENVRPTA